MRRRTILKGLLSTAGVAATGFRLPLAHAADYTGKLFVFVQADGGWDPTSFCDPKANTAAEPVINHWAERDEIREAGNIPYAPFANNATLFEKVLRPHAGDQRGGCTDQLAYGGDRAQLERSQLGRLPGDERALGGALRPGSTGGVPELRRLFGHRRRGALYAAEQRGPAAQHRAAGREQRRSGAALHERSGLDGGTCAAGAGRGAPGVGAEPAAGGCAQPDAVPVGVRFVGGSDGVCGCDSAGRGVGAAAGVRDVERQRVP